MVRVTLRDSQRDTHVTAFPAKAGSVTPEGFPPLGGTPVSRPCPLRSANLKWWGLA